MYIQETEINPIKQTFQQSTPTTVDVENDVYTKAINILSEQLISKDRQIEELTAALKIQTSSTGYNSRETWKSKPTKPRETSIPIQRLLKRAREQAERAEGRSPITP